MRVRMYVCSCMCVTKVRVKDAACQRWSWRWWHRGTVPGRRSVEHECSWLSMQLWRTSTERMPVKARHSHRHLRALLPTLGQSSGSRGQRLLDSLSGCETRACPPSKKFTGKVPAAVAKTQRLHACDLVTTWQLQYLSHVMSALHSVAQAQLGPACRSDHEQDQHLAASVCGTTWWKPACKKQNLSCLRCTALLKRSWALPVVATTNKTSTWPQVCVWNAAGRKKKVLKQAKIKHAETRGKKKHAGR